jgi:hypothetical protein
MRHGSSKHWEFLYHQLSVETDEVQKDIISAGLACTKEASIIRKYLDDQIGIDNCAAAFQSIAKKQVGSVVAWDFIKENYELLVKKSVLSMFCTLLCNSMVAIC